MFSLSKKVALVTGASRGVGKGVALGLGEAGATVYVTGRTLKGRHPGMPFLAGSLGETAEEISRLGGVGIPLQCDHTDDAQTRAVVERVRVEHGQLDILVNNVWGGYEGLHLWDERGQKWEQTPFWEQPLDLWDGMFLAGVRAHYITSTLAAPLMIAGGGLVVNISFLTGARHRDLENIPYHLAKSCDDHMAAAMANHLRDYNVAAVSLYPGLVRTEGIMLAEGHLDLSNSESPQFIGRAVAALASDPKVMEKSGRVLVAAQLALEYGFTDIDGKQPMPVTLETA